MVFIVEDEFPVALDLSPVLERRGWSVPGPVASIEKIQLQRELLLPKHGAKVNQPRITQLAPLGEAMQAQTSRSP
jgi:hypothetical protein